MHINQQPDTYPENFRALALTVLAGEATRRKTQGSNFNTGPLYYSIVGTVKTTKEVRLELGTILNRELSRSARRSLWSMILLKRIIRSANNWNLLLYRNINL